MTLSFTIPEYPSLVFLKPGDVIVLPSTSAYRDWVVTSVKREFEQGINKLNITANRPLTQKTFVQDGLLKDIAPEAVMNYYWNN